MNKKGFTLVEVLVVIGIIALLFGIGAPTYNIISKNVKQSTYENKVQYIETAASKYGNDTGNTIVFVNTLVEEGYVEADNEIGDVIDPRDNTRLNCHVVNIYYENENYYTSFSEEELLNLDGKTCDVDQLASRFSLVQLKIMNATNNDYNTWTEANLEAANGWIGTNAGIVVEVPEDIKGKVKKIEFENAGVKEERIIDGDFDQNNKYYIEASQILDSVYSVLMVAEEESNGKTIEKNYRGSIRVKIDKQRPIIYDNETKVNNAGEWTNNSKKITIYSSDQSGSGIYGYYIGNDSNCQVVSYDISEDTSYTKELDKGEYYICVKDKVGNLSEDISTKKVVVENIDKTSPTCSIRINGTKGNNNWYRSNVSFEVIGVDSESGIFNTVLSKSSINYDTNGETIQATVYDKAGNTGACSTSVKVDKTPPTISYSPAPGTYKEKYGITVNVVVQDSRSGLYLNNSKNGITTPYVFKSYAFANEDATHTINTTVYDMAGNVASSSARYVMQHKSSGGGHNNCDWCSGSCCHCSDGDMSKRCCC